LSQEEISPRVSEYQGEVGRETIRYFALTYHLEWRNRGVKWEGTREGRQKRIMIELDALFTATWAQISLGQSPRSCLTRLHE
jgi:hypothetical protein